MALLDSLPGVMMPVSEVPEALRDLWRSAPGVDEGPNKFRAIQSNLILHFGLETSGAEAKEALNRALEFAQRYPCRVICLCPTCEDGEHPMRGKLFSQCFLAGGAKHPVCCEALMLGYNPDDSAFLEHQVSIWLESDLPTYQWFHRVPPVRITESYLPFLKMIRRVTYDSSLDGFNYDKVSWPCPRGGRDMANARLLHVRQCLGQFLSAYPASVLTLGLSQISICHCKALSGEAYNFSLWLRECLIDAGAAEEISAGVSLAQAGFSVEWHFKGDQSFLMELNDELTTGCIRADFGAGPTEFPLHLKKVSPQLALAEALFF